MKAHTAKVVPKMSGSVQSATEIFTSEECRFGNQVSELNRDIIGILES